MPAAQLSDTRHLDISSIRQALILSQKGVSDYDAKSLDSRTEEAVRVKFDNLFKKLAIETQQQVIEAISQSFVFWLHLRAVVFRVRAR